MKTARNMKSSCNGRNEKLGRVEGFMFDLDGTLVLTDRSLRGYKVLPGAVEVLTELQSRGIPFVALTNGSAHAASEQAPKLRAAGLPSADEVLLTPTSVAADLMPRRGVKRALVLGTPGVAQPLADVGIETLFPGQEGAENVQAVYIGWHPDWRGALCGFRRTLLCDDTRQDHGLLARDYRCGAKDDAHTDDPDRQALAARTTAGRQEARRAHEQSGCDRRRSAGGDDYGASRRSNGLRGNDWHHLG